MYIAPTTAWQNIKCAYNTKYYKTSTSNKYRVCCRSCLYMPHLLCVSLSYVQHEARDFYQRKETFLFEQLWCEYFYTTRTKLSQTLQKGLLLLHLRGISVELTRKWKEEGGQENRKVEGERWREKNGETFKATWVDRLIFVYKIEVRNYSKWKGYYG